MVKQLPRDPEDVGHGLNARDPACPVRRVQAGSACRDGARGIQRPLPLEWLRPVYTFDAHVHSNLLPGTRIYFKKLPRWADAVDRGGKHISAASSAPPLEKRPSRWRADGAGERDRQCERGRKRCQGSLSIATFTISTEENGGSCCSR